MYGCFIVRRFPVGAVAVKNTQIYLIYAIYKRDDALISPDEILNAIKASAGYFVGQPAKFPVVLDAAVGYGCLNLLRPSTVLTDLSVGL